MKFPPHQALEGTKAADPQNEEAFVKNYLADHPDFFTKNPALLTHMELGHNEQGTTSLVERQIKVLRERNQQMQGQLIDMLHAAHNNEELLMSCNQFMLDILNSTSLADLAAKIIQSMKSDFDLDAVSLIIVGSDLEAGPALVYDKPEKIKSLLNCQFPDSQPLCGRLEAASITALFGELEKDLSSFALIPLGENCEFGLLTLASKDVDRFAPDMGTLFIELIAKLVTHLTSTYIHR